MACFSLRLPRLSRSRAALLASLGAAVLAAQGTPPPAQAPKPSAPLPKLADPLDGGWPREVKTTAGVVTVYQPQIDAWDGSRLSLYAAVSLKEKEDAAPIYGVVWADGQTVVDKEARLVTLTNREFKKVAFPSHPEKNGPLLAVVRKEVAPVDPHPRPRPLRGPARGGGRRQGGPRAPARPHPAPDRLLHDPGHPGLRGRRARLAPGEGHEARAGHQHPRPPGAPGRRPVLPARLRRLDDDEGPGRDLGAGEEARPRT